MQASKKLHKYTRLLKQIEKVGAPLVKKILGHRLVKTADT